MTKDFGENIFIIQSNLYERPPPNKEHPVNKGHTSVPLHWKNKGRNPPNKDHLSIKTMFCVSLGWPLFTGLTVVITTVLIK